MCAGMEISEEQRKLAIVNARRAKQGKNKSKEIFKFSDFIFFYFNCNLDFCPFSCLSIL